MAMSENVIHNISINNIELLAPVFAAVLQNTLRLEELIALQKDEAFDREKAFEAIVSEWSRLIVVIQETAKQAVKQQQ